MMGRFDNDFNSIDPYLPKLAQINAMMEDVVIVWCCNVSGDCCE